MAAPHLTKDEFWTELKTLAEGLSNRKLAQALDIPSSNAFRWRAGVTAPPAFCRQLLIDKLHAVRAVMALEKEGTE